MTLLLKLLAVILCICGAAFYSGIETGVISIRRLRLRHRLRQGDAAAKKLAFFLEEPNRLLGTTLVGTNLFVVLASILASSLSSQLAGPGGQVVAGLLVSAGLLVFGEYIPKAWFRAYPYLRSARFANVLFVSWKIFYPFGAAVTWIAGLVVPKQASGRQDLCSLATRDELKILTVEAEQNGVLSPEERTMIHQAVELAEKTAADIQTPLAKAVVVEAACSTAQLLELAQSNNYTRYPVQQAGGSGFEGVIDLFDVLTGGAVDTIAPYIRKAVLIPGSTPADDIMPRLRMARQSMGLVTDSEGVVIGLVTTDDILNQIVGGGPAPA
ncbi:CNNM domain-containing protein [Pontiella sp.]|uniref:CNNM domain-containing protein n=1 Tax=Pontiella sp. TaxID=2837462 RepID=UPI003561BD04